MKLLDYAIESTNEYMEKIPKSQRKKSGQFFTCTETAAFMASLFDIPDGKTELSILDAGAGSGILTIALFDRLQDESQIERISVTCYETDLNIIDLLRSNLAYACNNSTKEITYEVRTENYILSQVLEYNKKLGASPTPQKYDLIIGNPPYMKVGKDAPEAQAMPDICYGAPNLYFFLQLWECSILFLMGSSCISFLALGLLEHTLKISERSS